jgi:hypothetical protein
MVLWARTTQPVPSPLGQPDTRGRCPLRGVASFEIDDGRAPTIGHGMGLGDAMLCSCVTWE